MNPEDLMKIVGVAMTILALIAITAISLLISVGTVKLLQQMLS